jgi:FMN phosphatase YigB (HAD superfamily)
MQKSQITATKTTVVTDGDGTLYPFWEYFVPAMRTIIPVLAARLSAKLGIKLTLDDVSHRIAFVMKVCGTHEYPWVWECSEFWQDAKMRKAWKDYAEFRAQIVEPFWQAMDFERSRNLYLYDDVREALEAVHREKLNLVMLSDGPYYMVRAKLTQLGIGHLFTAVYALETLEPTAKYAEHGAKLAYALGDEELEYGRTRVRQFSNMAVGCPMHQNPPDWEKPNKRGLERILRELKVRPEEAIMVGDSLSKDGGVAKANGVAFLWARYGVQLARDYRKMIDIHFVHPVHRPVANKHDNAPKLPPMIGKHGASTWLETLDHLGPEPLPLKPTVLNASVHTQPVQGPGH